MKIKPSKCHIGTGSISYLGYEITAGSGIQPGLAKTETVRSFPEPCTIKEIRAFIGLTSFFLRAIKDYSLISGPLNSLVRKDSGYTTGKLPTKASKAFLNLKTALVSRPCLAPVNFNAPFIVTTDASETHYASCLSQKGADVVERPCGSSSKLLNSKESKQQPGMRERAALLHALRHWQPYLIGREFTLRTDHNPNLALAKGKMKSYDTLTDEVLQLMPFKMEFMNGNRMFVDALSRQTKNVLSVDLGMGPSCPVIFDEQVIRGHQTSDPDLQFHFMLHKNIIPSIPDKCQLKISSHIYNNLVCTFLNNGCQAIIAPRKLQSVLIFLAHNMSGHLSSKYTYERLAHNWFWPNMQSDIDNFANPVMTVQKLSPLLITFVLP